MVGEQQLAGRRLWLAWVVASGLGMTVGWLAVAMFLQGVSIYYHMVGVALGALVGVVEWLVLRQRVSLTKTWIGLSMGGWAVGGLVLAEMVISDIIAGRGDNPITFLGDWSIAAFGIFLGALIGAVVASLQWFLSRNSVAGAGSMIAWSAVGAAAAGLVIASRFTGSDIARSASLGAVAGALLGVTQWFVLRQRAVSALPWVLSGSVAWAVAMAVGTVIGRSVEFAPDSAATYAAAAAGAVSVMGAVVGLFLGGLQWLTLRKDVPGAGWWVVACVVGWAVASLAAAGILLIVGDRVEEWGGLPLLGVVAAIGLVAGAITGVAVVRLMPQPVRDVAAPLAQSAASNP